MLLDKSNNSPMPTLSVTGAGGESVEPASAAVEGLPASELVTVARLVS